MGNYRSVKRKVDRNRFEKCLKDRDLSVRALGRDMDINEKTIRRILSSGEGTVSVLDAICRHLKVDMGTLCGPDDSAEWHGFLQRVM